MAETKIDQAKMRFSRLVSSHSYSRFNQPHTDGESSSVEVKLSEEEEMKISEEEEMDAAEHTQPQTRCSRSASWKKWRMWISVAVLLFFFCLGLIIGLSTQHKSETPSCPSSDSEEPAVGQNYHVLESTMDWSDVVKLLNEKLSVKGVQDRMRDYSGERQAGSDGDNALARRIHEVFEQLQMDPWVDEPFVKLQFPSSSSPNKVWFGSEEIGSPRGFLAYSETGRKEGRAVYGNYGEEQDLKMMKENGVDLNGSVVLMKAGRISLAQKVENVAEAGAVAALIYPDPDDYDSLSQDAELYGHVHLGSGDPYTPGFPSFNHTRFPPASSSGLPEIVAQSITVNMALRILDKMGGIAAPKSFHDRFSNDTFGAEAGVLTVEVNSQLADTKICNVFGVIRGFVDPDQYVVIGAQRDSLTPGYARSAVGTALLVELARVFSEMIQDGFKPRRSVVFASWSGGDFGNVGMTEWLEGYATTLDKKAFSYISLDGVVTGVGSFKASASPLLHTVLQQVLEKITNPTDSRSSLFQSYGGALSSVLKPMEMNDGSYPFLAFSGIPSLSFSFTSLMSDYKYFGTSVDDKDHLGLVTGQKVGELAVAAAQVAGQVALRLVHDHILRLDVTRYATEIATRVSAIVRRTQELTHAKVENSEFLSTEWLIAAKSSFGRAAVSLQNDIRNSDVEDPEMSRIINDRIMKVERNFLSAYVSLRETLFRHVLFGNGWQTASDLENYLRDVTAGRTSLDMKQVLNRFALLTWTIQGCANDLAGDIWSLDNEI